MKNESEFSYIKLIMEFKTYGISFLGIKLIREI